MLTKVVVAVVWIIVVARFKIDRLIWLLLSQLSKERIQTITATALGRATRISRHGEKRRAPEAQIEEIDLQIAILGNVEGDVEQGFFSKMI